MVVSFTPLWPVGHLPLKGGDQLSSAISPISKIARNGGASMRVISLLVGEMSGRTEGGNVERSASAAIAEQLP